MLKWMCKDGLKTQSSFLGGLGLGGFCQELSMALEYDGVQHEREIPHFHRTTTDSFEQLERDALKNLQWGEFGIKLICIPSRHPLNNPTRMKSVIRRISMCRQAPQHRKNGILISRPQR
ncbi:hypothetical protein JG687_00005991 [Phytophthora cactorum]|uniref:Uncharacterized protein n=1 Tax=Phytophthora cactorum TaxID=29920 RepID=A0A8T1UJE6_9STRA|nr:hypothetical protein JG687_00005991 [Phytophthora cactorum]